jgi:mannose-6-phosphate isomerase-like protein (cupin superfamily)
MYLLDSIPRKVDKQTFRSLTGVDLDEAPCTLEALQAIYRTFPRQYLSGWWMTPSSTPLIEYLEGRSNDVMTNYHAHFQATSNRHVRTASAVLQKKHGIPFRTWMASFLSKPGLSRPLHYDWYDGILFNFSGRKELTVHLPIPVSTDGFFRYKADVTEMEPPLSKGERFILDPGEALYLPAFAHHSVDNTGSRDSAAFSFAFDSSALLIDIFRHTLEYCTRELRTPYQGKSMRGARVFGTKSNWQLWRNSVATEKRDHPIYAQIRDELIRDTPAAADMLRHDEEAQELMRQEWKKFVFAASFDLGTHFNP